MLTRIFAAGLSREMDLRMVAPSLVTVILWFDADSTLLVGHYSRTVLAYGESCSFPVIVSRIIQRFVKINSPWVQALI